MFSEASLKMFCFDLFSARVDSILAGLPAAQHQSAGQPDRFSCRCPSPAESRPLHAMFPLRVAASRKFLPPEIAHRELFRGARELPRASTATTKQLAAKMDFRIRSNR